jgi:hypothetical protein
MLNDKDSERYAQIWATINLLKTWKDTLVTTGKFSEVCYGTVHISKIKDHTKDIE